MEVNVFFSPFISHVEGGFFFNMLKRDGRECFFLKKMLKRDGRGFFSQVHWGGEGGGGWFN